MRDNEQTIIASLQREAERAPLMDAPPPEVVRRVKRRRAARAGLFAVSVGAVVGVAAAALVALSPLANRGASVGGDPSTPPATIGDVTRVASATDPIVGSWTAEVYFDNGQPSLRILGEYGGGGFSSAPIRDNIFGGLGAGSNMLGPNRYAFDVQGVVSAKAARVTLTLVDGTELEASLFAIPPAYFGDAKVYLIFGDRVLSDHRHPGSTLTAYDADGSVIDTFDLTGSDEPGGTSPEVDGVIAQLRQVRDAITRADPLDPFADFDLATLEGRLPEIPLNTSVSVVSGEVSVRVTDARHAVLVATASEAPVMCIAVERSELRNGGWNYAYGLADAQTNDTCRGGWGQYLLPPM